MSTTSGRRGARAFLIGVLSMGVMATGSAMSVVAPAAAADDVSTGSFTGGRMRWQTEVSPTSVAPGETIHIRMDSLEDIPVPCDEYNTMPPFHASDAWVTSSWFVHRFEGGVATASGEVVTVWGALSWTYEQHEQCGYGMRSDVVAGEVTAPTTVGCYSIGGLNDFVVATSGGSGTWASFCVTSSVVDAVDDEAQTERGHPIPIYVLENDSPAGAVSVAGVGSAAHGTVTFTSDYVYFEPDSAYSGPDEFTYTISDGLGASDTATVHVEIANNPPIARPDSRNSIGAAVDIEVLANDDDPDGDTIRVVSATQPAEGGVVEVIGHAVRFTPTAGFDGTATFTYTIADDYGSEATATVTVVVHPCDQAFTRAVIKVSMPFATGDAEVARYGMSVPWCHDGTTATLRYDESAVDTTADRTVSPLVATVLGLASLDVTDPVASPPRASGSNPLVVSSEYSYDLCMDWLGFALNAVPVTRLFRTAAFERLTTGQKVALVFRWEDGLERALTRLSRTIERLTGVSLHFDEFVARLGAEIDVVPDQVIGALQGTLAPAAICVARTVEIELHLGADGSAASPTIAPGLGGDSFELVDFDHTP